MVQLQLKDLAEQPLSRENQHGQLMGSVIKMRQGMLIGVQSAVNCPYLLSNLPQGCHIVSVVHWRTKGELLPQQLYVAFF